MLLELLDILLGIAFGLFHKGKEDYLGILRNGAIAGILVSVLIVLVAMFLSPGSISPVPGLMGVAGIIMEVIIFVVLFVIGAFTGDQIERVVRK
jgi:hypothetical protein